MRRLLESEAAELRFLVERHLVETSSSVARSILDDWPRQVGRFWVLRAKDPDVPSRPSRRAVDGECVGPRRKTEAFGS